ncbi:YafY family transcriptional regulator [Brevibacillus ruminantium]|uniref:YafY family transcriptional regulator n=1 Tax=Brevibacillus ruminantium TaxID=2950604 RepID=A0ABY4WET8_9BACL|nr:YafY family protein [Brevibacillus ruminantium]USG65587.1 YafY family transcriptional regulator [Brevibacillus ruminantium]
MNKTDRQLAILLELQRRGSLRAEDLAAVFETSVRTIYRDVQALSEAGVPIIGAPGQGYSLMEGYFLPPLHFTAEEAVTMLLGLDFVEQQFDPVYRASAQDSRKKIESILPEAVRREAARVRSGFKLLTSHAPADDPVRITLQQLRQAIQEERKVRFLYTKKLPEKDGNRQHLRDVTPYGLAFVNGSWSLLGFCDLRQELRHFRLDRMASLCLLEEKAVPPADFNLQAYRPDDNRHLSMTVRMAYDVAEHVKESRFYFIDTMAEQPDGLYVTLRFRQPEEVLPWVLGFGAKAVVIEPESFRERIRCEIKKMQLHY